MGCFLSCFRGRPDPAGLRDPLVPKTRLGDAFLDDHHHGDGDEAAKLEAGEITKDDLGDDGGVDDDGLRREANYLKSCGAISETPPEMLKSSNQIKAEDINEIMSCNGTANNVQEIQGETVSENKDHLSEGLNCDRHDILNHDQNTDEDADNVTEVESAPRSSSQERSSGHNITNQKLDPSDSPFPTPLVLRGDVQTPGFTAAYQQGSFKPGKRGRASKQFVYPVLRPIENKLPWTELKDESSSPVVSSHPPKRRYLSAADSAEKPPPQQQTFSFNAGNREQPAEQVASPEEPRDENSDRRQLLGGGGVGELLNKSSENGKHGVASLSSWLKTSSGDGEGQGGGIAGDVGKLPGLEGIDLSNLPIFVASGLNWDDNENNPTPMMPKAWDGNGIPNTTTKYKEDQRVSWHATPFEERLMKVLSDEKPHHQRKMSGKLIQLEEEDNMTESPASATASS